jgi:hypothetical protein
MAKAKRKLRMCIEFPPDLFSEIKAGSKVDLVSFGAQVRKLTRMALNIQKHLEKAR